MRRIFVAMVIAGASCRAPEPRAPSNAVAVEHAPAPPPPPAPPAGRIEVVQAKATDPPLDLEQTFGPVIASGTDAGRPWSLRGRIDASDAATFVQISGHGGGGGKGALPFQNLRWKKLGHFGSVGSGEHQGIGLPLTRTLVGTVSKQTATIDVRLADGTTLAARIIDTGDPRASFFVVVWSTPSSWDVLIARDATGVELETYRPPPSPPTPTQARTTSTP